MLIGLGIILAASVGIYFYLDKSDPVAVYSEAQQDKAKAELDKSFETLTPQGEMPEYEMMTEFELLDEVHGMTHQKVLAEQKWGSSEITKDKVVKLYEIVKNKNFKNAEIRSMLLEILEPWTRGDFSNAVEDHNRIWNYKEGNVGEAERLLTPVEEQKYIEKQFR